MLQYILECIAFQLVFLIIYDLFLKRETFFQWNRVYLICTYILSIILPWVKIEALKTEAPEVFHGYSEFLWNTNDATIVVSSVEESSFNMPWEYVVLFSGMLLAASFLGYKLFQIYILKQKGEVRYFKHFTRIVIANSSLAFSFFKSIFLGDKVLEKEHQNILEHELVHIREKHSYDLMFFELMRIVGWFNPLVYVYQNRVSELHEFIADATVAKTNKKEQYQFLLSQVFQTQNISFINQFFNSSLIKKRIVMLTKEKSKQVFKLKYVLLIPILVGMLFYTSCSNSEIKLTDSEMIVTDIDDMSSHEDEILFNKLEELSKTDKHWEFLLKGENSSIKYTKSYNGSYVKFSDEKTIDATMVIEETALSNKINDLMEEIISKDTLYTSEKGALAAMIYNTYPNGVEGISGERGNVVFEKNQNYSEMTSSYNQLVAERQRLLKSSNEKNPIIVNLDVQIAGLKNAISQESETVPFAKVDQVPVFPGCENEDDSRACFQKSIQLHISKNFRYPQVAQEKGIQGRVSVMFTMDAQGSITNVRLRGPDSLLEAEAARIIAKLPKMSPGVHKGKKVNVPFSIPITFKLTKSKTKKDGTNNAEIPFAMVEEVPVFPGCDDEENKRICFNKMMQKHIGDNFKYPKEAQEQGIEGRVNVIFKVAKDGSIQNVRMRGSDPILEKEVARIISLLPKMTPGRNKGKAVEVPFSIPIDFKLGEEKEVSPLGLSFNIEPIYYIDGVKSTKDKLSLIGPNQIESMFVLKGEVALEKYGEGAKNGVVEVITKKKN